MSVSKRKLLNLPKCPPELLALDANAAVLWPKLFKRSGATVDPDSESNGVIRDKRGAILLGNVFSKQADSLTSRLEFQRERESRNSGKPDELARARIWFHVAEASAPGDYLPDLTANNLYILNPWIVTSSLKFKNPAFERMKTKAETVQLCANDRCHKGPSGGRAILTVKGKYCSNACRKSMGLRLPPQRTKRRKSKTAVFAI